MFHAKIQIRFSDCDMLKHVNNAVYLEYFETARVAFLNSELPNWNWDKEGIILANNNIDYIEPLYLEDDCTITIICSRIGNSSFTLNYQVLVKASDREILKATGSSVLVCVDFSTGKTIPIPSNLIQILQKNFVAL